MQMLNREMQFRPKSPSASSSQDSDSGVFCPAPRILGSFRVRNAVEGGGAIPANFDFEVLVPGA